MFLHAGQASKQAGDCCYLCETTTFWKLSLLLYEHFGLVKYGVVKAGQSKVRAQESILAGHVSKIFHWPSLGSNDYPQASTVWCVKYTLLTYDILHGYYSFKHKSSFIAVHTNISDTLTVALPASSQRSSPWHIVVDP